MLSIWLFRLLVVGFLAWFGVQVATRLKLVSRAKGTLDAGDLPARASRFLREVVFQSKVIAEKPVVGIAHALVFWGFLAFAGYTATQFARGLGLFDLTGALYSHVSVADPPTAWMFPVIGLLLVSGSYLLPRKAPSTDLVLRPAATR